MRQNTYPQKLFAEVLGTATLVFIGVGSVPATLLLGGKAPFTMAELGMISLAFALAVVALVYSIGHISGCQINPAVTLGLAATGKMPWRDVPGYLAAQVVGAVLGALAIIAVLGHKAVDVGLGIASYGPHVSAGQAFGAELIGTFLLVFVVFGAIDARAPGGFAGIAIGFAVFAIIIPVAPATGAAINPARTLGPMIVGQLAGGTVHWNQLPVYLLAEIAGGVLAGFAYLALNHHRTAAPATPAQPAAPSTETPAAEGVLS
ncbi:aquaporin family protein [Streptacidiphilus pinicola]|uniref:Aquaporin family protein n=1 Tax=Streptacidiphilus pinicola TaxID=2219663 RepID=A0A2X0IK13_9ACTN|nr:aquaporin [Streptacidiphilus pinicola]RAG85474.1 aquaporin family protein [Streptacidiphilus pinicola]